MTPLKKFHLRSQSVELSFLQDPSPCSACGGCHDSFLSYPFIRGPSFVFPYPRLLRPKPCPLEKTCERSHNKRKAAYVERSSLGSEILLFFVCVSMLKISTIHSPSSPAAMRRKEELRERGSKVFIKAIPLL